MAFLHNGSSAMANTNHTSHHPSLFSVPFAPEEYWQKVNSSAPPIRYIEALKALLFTRAEAFLYSLTFRELVFSETHLQVIERLCAKAPET